MSSRSYRSWDTTVGSSYVPRRTYAYTSPYSSEPYYNTYSSYRPYRTSERSRQDSALYTPHTSGKRFDFVSGRYTADNRYTNLTDTPEPSYYQTLTDLYMTTNKLQEDYRNILDRYNNNRASGYGSGLPEGYGAARYMNRDRLPPSQRYDVYDRTKRNYDTEITEYPHYARAKKEDYHGSIGGITYSKEMVKGTYDTHDTGPRTREDLDLYEHSPGDKRAGRAMYGRDNYHPEGSDPRGYPDNRYGYDRDGYDSRDPRYQRDGREPYGDYDRYGREPGDHDRDGRNRYLDGNDLNDRGLGGGGGGRGGGLKKSASKHDVDGYTRDRGDRGDKISGISDEDYEDVGEKGKLDSGIHSPEDADDILLVVDDEDLFEEEALPEPVPTPEPEIIVYNEITQEDFQQMLEEEAEKENPLCDFPLIATVTAQKVKIDKIVGEFRKADMEGDEPALLSPLPGMTSCLVTSPLPTADTPDPLSDNDIELDLATTPAVQPDGVEVNLEMGEPTDISLPVSANVELNLETTPASQADGVDVNLEMGEPTEIPLPVTAKVVQLEEETIVTETTETVVEKIAPENTVPDEIHLALQADLPEESNDVAAKAVDPVPVQEPEPKQEVAPVQEPESVEAKAPVQEPASVQEPAPVQEIAPKEAEVTMTQAPTENNETKNESKVEDTPVTVKIEDTAAEIIIKDEQSRKPEEKQVNGEIKEAKVEEKKEEKKAEEKKAEEKKADSEKKEAEKPKSPATKLKPPASKLKPPAAKLKAPEEPEKPDAKKPWKFREKPAAPRKKKLW